MRKFSVLMGAAIVSAVLLVAIVTTATFAQGHVPGSLGPDMMGSQGSYGPQMVLPGYGVRAPGCAGPDTTGGQGMIGGWGHDRFAATGRRLTAVRAQQAAVTYLAGYYNNPDLEVVVLLEFEQNFYAQVAEKSTAINACELLIDPYTGAVQPEYGPNRMWNTKYGQMSDLGGMMPSSTMDGLAPMQAHCRDAGHDRTGLRARTAVSRCPEDRPDGREECGRLLRLLYRPRAG